MLLGESTILPLDCNFRRLRMALDVESKMINWEADMPLADEMSAFHSFPRADDAATR